MKEIENFIKFFNIRVDMIKYPQNYLKLALFILPHL
jgi:hypothetical protein